MNASSHLRDVWTADEELEALRDSLIAVVEAAEKIRDDKERVPVRHKTGVNGEPRYVHEHRSRAVVERPLAALETLLERKP